MENFFISKTANINYLAKIVQINEFLPHPNPEATKMKRCLVGGYNIIVGIDTQPGLYIYFPEGCAINKELLSYCNLFRDSNKNRDISKSGFFEDNGRVKSIRLRGKIVKEINGVNQFVLLPEAVSEGFLMEFKDFCMFIGDKLGRVIPTPEINTTFDVYGNDENFIRITKKYVVKSNVSISSNNQKKKVPKRLNKIIDTQFRFHYETSKLKNEPTVIEPDDLISCTLKVHGTSGISAYVLCHKKLSFKERIAKFLTKRSFDEYDYIYSSRKVIKNSYYNPNATTGFYDCDVWNYAHEYVKPYLEKGMSLYYEILGFTPNGGYIQSEYDYGCIPPEVVDGHFCYLPEVNFKVRIYRITLTNIDGIVHEFSAKEVQTWCKNNGLYSVYELYYGIAKDLYPDISIDDNWSYNFLLTLQNDSNFLMEDYEPLCNNHVPREGIVIKKEDMRPRAWKVKSFLFFSKVEDVEALKGITNMEDNN